MQLRNKEKEALNNVLDKNRENFLNFLFENNLFPLLEEYISSMSREVLAQEKAEQAANESKAKEEQAKKEAAEKLAALEKDDFELVGDGNKLPDRKKWQAIKARVPAILEKQSKGIQLSSKEISMLNHYPRILKIEAGEYVDISQDESGKIVENLVSVNDASAAVVEEQIKPQVESLFTFSPVSLMYGAAKAVASVGMFFSQATASADSLQLKKDKLEVMNALLVKCKQLLAGLTINKQENMLSALQSLQRELEAAREMLAGAKKKHEQSGNDGAEDILNFVQHTISWLESKEIKQIWSDRFIGADKILSNFNEEDINDNLSLLRSKFASDLFRILLKIELDAGVARHGLAKYADNFKFNAGQMTAAVLSVVLKMSQEFAGSEPSLDVQDFLARIKSLQVEVGKLGNDPFVSDVQQLLGGYADKVNKLTEQKVALSKPICST